MAQTVQFRPCCHSVPSFERQIQTNRGLSGGTRGYRRLIALIHLMQGSLDVPCRANILIRQSGYQPTCGPALTGRFALCLLTPVSQPEVAYAA